LAGLFSPAQFAIYRIGNFNLPFISLAYTSVGNVILPRLSQYSEQINGIQKALTLWKKYIVKNATVTFPLLAYFFFVAESFIVFLFGEPYRESVSVFRIVILCLMMQMFGFGYLLRAFGMTKYIVPANIIKLVFAVFLGYLLISRYGYIGAAVSYLVAYWSNGVIQLYFTMRRLNISLTQFLPWKDLGKLMTASLVGLIPLVFLESLMIQFHQIIYLLASGLVYFCLEYLLFYKIGYLPKITSPQKFVREI
jgi:O-antigen/teichoic acid export membrane protein